MNKTKEIAFTRLRNETMIGFFTDVANLAQDIDIKDVKDLFASYLENLQRFSDYTTSVSEANSKKKISQLSIKRLNAYRDFKDFVKLFRRFKDKTKSDLGNEIWGYIKDSGIISRIDQKRFTGVAENAIKCVRSLVSSERYAAIYEGSSLQESFEALCSAEAEFEIAIKDRTSVRSDREAASSKQLRDACIESYSSMVNVIQAIAITKSDGDCISFINRVNTLIDSNVSQYKARDKRRLKKKEEEAKEALEAKDTQKDQETQKGQESQKVQEVKETPKAEVKDTQVAKEGEVKDTQEAKEAKEVLVDTVTAMAS